MGVPWGIPLSKTWWGTPYPRLDGVPPIQDWMGYSPLPTSAKWALAMRRVVCLLRSRRRTFLLDIIFGRPPPFYAKDFFHFSWTQNWYLSKGEHRWITDFPCEVLTTGSGGHGEKGNPLGGDATSVISSKFPFKLNKFRFRIEDDWHFSSWICYWKPFFNKADCVRLNWIKSTARGCHTNGSNFISFIQASRLNESFIQKRIYRISLLLTWILTLFGSVLAALF